MAFVFQGWEGKGERGDTRRPSSAYAWQSRIQKIKRNGVRNTTGSITRGVRSRIKDLFSRKKWGQAKRSKGSS